MVSLSYSLTGCNFFGIFVYNYFPIILSLITTEIRMALNTERIPPTIMTIVFSNCTNATSEEGPSQGNVLSIFAIFYWQKWFFCGFLGGYPILYIVCYNS